MRAVMNNLVEGADAGYQHLQKIVIEIDQAKCELDEAKDSMSNYGTANANLARRLGTLEEEMRQFKETLEKGEDRIRQLDARVLQIESILEANGVLSKSLDEIQSERMVTRSTASKRNQTDVF